MTELLHLIPWLIVVIGVCAFLVHRINRADERDKATGAFLSAAREAAERRRAAEIKRQGGGKWV